MYQDERKLDFHALGREIKRKREAKGWTQEYLAQLVDRTPRSIMYFENRGQHPSLNTFQYAFRHYLTISIKSVGIYAVATRHNPEISTTILCCPAILATFPTTPLKSPAITRTLSPLL